MKDSVRVRVVTITRYILWAPVSAILLLSGALMIGSLWRINLWLICAIWMAWVAFAKFVLPRFKWARRLVEIGEIDV